MRIPKNHSQFERLPALFITSGEYEAIFHVAHKGELENVGQIKMEPKKEAKEKQGFTRSGTGTGNMSTYSHRGKYVEDLKTKFSHKVHEKIKDIVSEKKLKEIYIFAPKYVTKRILKELEKSQQKLVRMQFYKEYTKDNPLKLIEIFDREVEEMQKIATKTPDNQILLE